MLENFRANVLKLLAPFDFVFFWEKSHYLVYQKETDCQLVTWDFLGLAAWVTRVIGNSSNWLVEFVYIVRSDL